MNHDDLDVWSLAVLISDGRPIDWEDARRAVEGEESLDRIRFLRAVYEIASMHQDSGRIESDSPVALAPVAPAEGEPERPAQWAHLLIRGLVGRGSFGSVYRAWDRDLDREVALKLIGTTSGGQKAEAGSTVLKEGQQLARIRHPNVVAVYGASAQGDQIGLWMELIEGCTLEELLETRGRFGAEETTLIGLALCRALRAVHSTGVVHRDIKARNVMREEGGRIVLMDFGAGTEMHAETASLVSTIVGTPLYMAPEVLRGEPPSAQSDLYSLGTLLFRLVTKRYPLEAQTVTGLLQAHERGEARLLRDIRPDVSEAFVRVVERCLHHDPRQRFGSAGEMERALEEALNVATLSKNPSWPHRIVQRLQRQRLAVAIAALIVIASLAISPLARDGTLRRLLSGVTSNPHQWRADGVPLCDLDDEQRRPSMIADGESGTIAVWQDSRNGNADIYAQRIDAAGRALWQAHGVPVSIASEGQLMRNDLDLQLPLVPALVSDGAGGAIITWQDHRGDALDIYAQHVSAAGTVASGWPIDGLGICTAFGYQVDPVIVADDAGGAIIGWRFGTSDSTGLGYDLFMQRVTAAGHVAPGWPPDGLLICGGPGDHQGLMMCADGYGGALLTWVDYRSGVASVYAQRVTGAGHIAAGWPDDGVALCTATGEQFAPMAVADGAGGIFVTWEDRRSGNRDIYAQHVTASGRRSWDPAGLGICVFAIHNQCNPTIVSDGAGGAIITWFDWRHFCRQGRTCSDIFAQRVNGEGIVQWAQNGAPITNIPGDEALPSLTGDGAGGAIIAWLDCRNATPPLSNTPGSVDLYVQRVDSSGKTLWTENGVAVCTAHGNQLAHLLLSDGVGGTYIVWEDGRDGESNVYMNHVTSMGVAAAPTPP